MNAAGHSHWSASVLATAAAIHRGEAEHLDPAALHAPFDSVARVAQGSAKHYRDIPGFLATLTDGWMRTLGTDRDALAGELTWAAEQLNGTDTIAYMRAAAEAQPGDAPTDDGDAERFWNARPVHHHIRESARARMVSPWAHLGVIHARITAATPHTVTLPPIIGGRGSLNIAVGLVGRPGAGKGAAEAAARDAIDLGPAAHSFDTHKIGSGQGIAHAYARRTKQGDIERIADSCLFRVDEIDQIAGNAAMRGATLLPELRSALMGEAIGAMYVDITRRLEIGPHTYRFAITAGIQPLRAAVLLDDADGGTPQRFLWMPATDPDAPDTPPTEPPVHTWTPPRWRNELPVCDRARTEIIAARRTELRGEGEALNGHRLLQRAKVAAALNHLAGQLGITDEAWDLAETVMATSDATRAAIVQALADKATDENTTRGRREGTRAAIADEAKAERAIPRVAAALMRTIARHHDMTAGELRKTLRSTDRDYYEAANERLTAAGQITAETTNRGTRYRHA